MDTTSHRGPGPRRRPLAALVAATGLVLAACASDPAPVPTAPEPEPTPTVTVEEGAVEWTGRVCSALIPVVEALRMPPALDPADPAATQRAYSSYLGDARQKAERALEEVTAAGPPPVEGGEQLAQEVRNQVANLRDDLAEARAQVDRVDPRDPAAIGQAVAAAGNVLSSLGNSTQALSPVSGDPRLEPAFREAPSCAQLRTS